MKPKRSTPTLHILNPEVLKLISKRLGSERYNGRFGVILAKEGGALAKLLPIFQA
jgi:NAD dependent epimerase/dehydratase family enzyme